MSKKNGSQVTMKKQTTPIPNGISGIAEFLAEIASIEEKMDTITKRLGTKAMRMKAKADEQLEPLKAQGKRLFDGIAAYAEVHRQELTTEEKKSLEFVAGTIGWRLNPSAVEFDVSDEEMVERLEKLGFPEFVHVEKKPNREAMQANKTKAESITGITFEQDEDFYIKIKTEKVEVEKKKKVKKKKSKKVDKK